MDDFIGANLLAIQKDLVMLMGELAVAAGGFAALCRKMVIRSWRQQMTAKLDALVAGD